MNWTVLLGAAVMGASVAVIVGEKKARPLGQSDPDCENDPNQPGCEDPGAVAGAPSGGGGGAPAGGPGPVGVVAGAPSGGGMPAGPIQGTPMPVSNPSPAGGFPGVFPTAGPGNSLFFGGGFGGWGGGWGWPYGYPYPVQQYPNYAQQYECRWKETPPKDDTPLICKVVRPTYPVAWGPPNWGWW